MIFHNLGHRHRRAVGDRMELMAIRDGHALPMEGPGLGTELQPAVFERSDLIVRRSAA